MWWWLLGAVLGGDYISTDGFGAGQRLGSPWHEGHCCRCARRRADAKDLAGGWGAWRRSGIWLGWEESCRLLPGYHLPGTRREICRAAPQEDLLGESRSLALKRYNHNEKALKQKGRWEDFAGAIQEYGQLGHAELVPPEELQKVPSSTFYLPIHGVLKEASTTTKLRVVFDATAKSKSGASLNDTLLPGPSLYPLLSSILTKFRLPLIGMSANISKMFREVGLQEGERDYHRFLLRNQAGDIQDWRITRLTIGVTSSPYLATQVLKQVANDHRNDFHRAARIVENVFYVDDCLTGADTLEEAVEIRQELNDMLSRAQMTLRKWRSSSKQLLQTIPHDIKESGDLHISTSLTECSKALGFYWNTSTDTLHVSTPDLADSGTPTKRQVASAVARTFDVLGWFSPATVTIKILLQQLWERKIDWDERIPDELTKTWDVWKDELSMLTRHPIPRRLAQFSEPVISRQLHGFCDASTAAYGGVVYLRLLHTDTSVSVSLVTSKTRVAPLSGLTIPRLELCGALLLSKLLMAVTGDLRLVRFIRRPGLAQHGACQAEGVRSRDICTRIPAEQWRYVATNLNPADFASRGLSPQELLQKELWWAVPPWLQADPELWPRRPDINLSRELPELRTKVLVLQPPDDFLWGRYSSKTDCSGLFLVSGGSSTTAPIRARRKQTDWLQRSWMERGRCCWNSANYRPSLTFWTVCGKGRSYHNDASCRLWDL